MIVAGFVVAAAAGAVVRFHLSPYGWRATLAVNVVGSLLLGWLVAARGAESDVSLVLGTGFCGALTTFGTFALEASSGPARTRMAVIATNVVGCIGAAWIGFSLG